MAESLQLQRMTRFDATFSKVMAYYQRMIDTSNTADIKKHISLSVTHGQPSACLKFYNELIANTNFEMKPRLVLESDAIAFRATIDKLQKAHDVEVQWLKHEMMQQSASFVSEKMADVVDTLKEEVLKVQHQFETVSADLAKQQFINAEYRDELARKNFTITELKAYINSLRVQLKWENDHLTRR